MVVARAMIADDWALEPIGGARDVEEDAMDSGAQSVRRPQEASEA